MKRVWQQANQIAPIQRCGRFCRHVIRQQLKISAAARAVYHQRGRQLIQEQIGVLIVTIGAPD